MVEESEEPWAPDVFFDPTSLDPTRNGEEGFDEQGLCCHCRLPRTEKGHDPCIANLPGVVAACCGHGIYPGYFLFKDRTHVRVWPEWVWRDL